MIEIPIVGGGDDNSSSAAAGGVEGCGRLDEKGRGAGAGGILRDNTPNFR